MATNIVTKVRNEQSGDGTHRRIEGSHASRGCRPGQDRRYREREEERGLGLENDLREIEVIRRRIEVAPETGVPEEWLAPLLEDLLGRPLDTLGALQDRGIIDATTAEIRELSAGDTNHENE